MAGIKKRLKGYGKKGDIMSEKDNGGPAFPQTLVDFGRGPEIADNYGMGGMSLRDWFAGQALAGILSGIKNKQDIRNNYHHAADEAYGYADAMLTERAKA